jgi:hypothetical protein
MVECEDSVGLKFTAFAGTQAAAAKVMLGSRFPVDFEQVEAFSELEVGIDLLRLFEAETHDEPNWTRS